MRIEVAKVDLEGALSVANLSAGSTSDLSGHYLFRVKEDRIQVLSYDMRLFSSSPLPCKFEGEEGDAFTVEASRLNQWMSGVGDGVLTLTKEGDGTVQAKGSRSKVRFRSLDPAKFPYWDNLLTHAKPAGKADSISLARALSVSRWFVSTDDTSKPELCQIEAIKGVLWATDRRSLSSVEMPALPDLNIRIPGKEVSTLIKFLSSKEAQKGPVEIQEAERPTENGGGASAIFTRGDGSYLGITRPVTAFPTLTIERDTKADTGMILDRSEFLSAISVLLAGAPKGQEAVTFRYDKEESVLLVSMPCEAGGKNEHPLTQSSVSNGDKFDMEFTVDYPYIKGLGETFGLSSIEFGITQRGRGGFISFSSEDGGENNNRYFSVIVWRT